MSYVPAIKLKGRKIAIMLAVDRQTQRERKKCDLAIVKINPGFDESFSGYSRFTT